MKISRFVHVHWYSNLRVGVGGLTSDARIFPFEKGKLSHFETKDRLVAFLI